MEPHRGWTIASSSWMFLRKRWLDREQELITVIQKETKRTEEKEEAGYHPTSPTWSILRALQKINKAKRIEGEAIMSALPFFQSAGRGDLKFWGEDDGPSGNYACMFMSDKNAFICRNDLKRHIYVE